MIWEWYQPSALLFLLAPAVGHLSHFILAINVTAGIGFTEHAMDRARNALFAILFGSTALLLWGHFHAPWWTWSGTAYAYAILCVVSGLIILPLSSLTLRLRPRPKGISGHSSLRDFAATGDPHQFIGTGPGSSLLRLPGNESFKLRLREWNVSLSNLPEALDGFRIVQLTDLHLAPCYDRRYFELVFDASKTWDADLLLLTGDVVEHLDAIPWIEPLLGHLSARVAKFAVLGNHDADYRPRDIIRELDRAGFETLEGRWTSLDLPGATLAVGGTSAPWGPEPDPKTIPPADFRLLLSHSPDLFYKAERWGVDVMFSGHNHGGQIRLPLVGPVFMPSRYSRRFDRGFFRRRDLLLYVSEGISGLHPVRYGCAPEITAFTLKTALNQPFANQSRAHVIREPNHPNLEADRV